MIANVDYNIALDIALISPAICFSISSSNVENHATSYCFINMPICIVNPD